MGDALSKPHFIIGSLETSRPEKTGLLNIICNYSTMFLHLHFKILTFEYDRIT